MPSGAPAFDSQGSENSRQLSKHETQNPKQMKFKYLLYKCYINMYKLFKAE